MKRRYGLCLVGLALAALLALPVLRYVVATSWMATLLRDVDHRMTPADFADLNSDNIRAARDADGIHPDDFNIVVLGDSYVFGFLLPARFSLPQQLEDQLRAHYGTDRINVWNFGWTSSSPYLSLRLLRDIGKKYQPDLVILNLDMTDFKDDFFYRSVLEKRGPFRHVDQFPHIVAQMKLLTSLMPMAEGLHRRWFGYPTGGDYFVARQPMSESLVYFETVLDSLSRIHAYSRDELNAPFVVFFPPRHWQYTDQESPDSWEADAFDVLGPYALEPFRYFESLRGDLPYPFIPLLDDFRQVTEFPLSFRGDSHWNATGARVAAGMMMQHCRRLGCFAALEAVPVAPPSSLP